MVIRFANKCVDSMAIVVSIFCYKNDYGFPVEKHFFGTRHGKGPCDGEFGVVKRSVSSAVMSRNVIVRNATEFYEYAREFLSKPKDEPSDVCCHTQRSFFFVDEHDINRKRPDRINVKAIPNTRQNWNFLFHV
jgi:hypothetical protein